MKKILRNHSLVVLVSLAVIFLVMIVSVYAWGVDYLVTAVGKANIQRSAATAPPRFDIGAAAKLDYRDTVPQP